MSAIYWWAISIVSFMVGLYLYAEVDWQGWYEWLNPYDFTKGIIDGKKMRAKEAFEAHLQKQHDDHMKFQERMALSRIDEKTDPAQEFLDELTHIDTRRPGAKIHRSTIEGAITGGAAAPDAEFIRRYGSPKTMTLETLEKLMEERKRKDPEYEDGF